MLPIQSSLPVGLPQRAVSSVPSIENGPSASAPAAPKAAEPPTDVSYEPLLAGALRRTWTFLSGLFRRESGDVAEPIGGGSGTVTVQRGDSLSKIAQRALGDGNRWREIFDANRDTISNPNVIHPGQVLRLPGGSAPAPQPAPSGAYTVRGGDTLSKVAQQTLGRADRWREIYDLNRDKLSNPNILWPGLTLRLPGGASSPAPAQTSPGASSGKMASPVQGRTSSPFGMRRHPITGQNKLHTGLDTAAPSGTPVKAPQPGTVTFAGWNGGYGNYVVIDHGNGLQTAYAHMSAINVRRGQTVQVGTQVGKVGSTGMSTGPHLHFEVKRNGQFVNPQGYLA